MVLSPPSRPLPGVLEHNDIILGEYKIDLCRTECGNLCISVERNDGKKVAVEVLDILIPSDLHPEHIHAS